MSLVSNVLMLTGPLFMLQVYDRVLASRSVPTLVVLSALMLGLFGFYGLIEWLRSRMAIRCAGMIDDALAQRLFKGAILQRGSNSAERGDPLRDLDTVRQFVASPAPMALFDLPWIPIYLVLCFLLHPALGWFALCGAVVVCLLLVLNEIMAHRPARALLEIANQRQSRTNDARINAETVIAMGMTDAVGLRWLETARTYVVAQHLAADWTAFYGAVTKSFRLALQSAVLALGAYLVINGALTSGVMIAASILSARALAPVEQLVTHWRSFVAARQAARRIGLVLRELPDDSRHIELPLPSKSLSVVNLATAWTLRQRPVISGVSFEMEAGTGLGVLGPSGSGKTSLIKAVLGIWPVLQGEVRFDGAEPTQFRRDRLGGALGYLPQSVDLFDGSVAENIARFSPDATSEEIIKAAQSAGIHEMITALPQGYATAIGERGTILSAGQRQRIGLARALFGDPFLLVLDEPNSNLDAEGEAALTAALFAAKARGAIFIVIAHRPSAIAAADKILLLQGGRQSAFGPKEEVLSNFTRPPTQSPVPSVAANVRARA